MIQKKIAMNYREDIERKGKINNGMHTAKQERQTELKNLAHREKKQDNRKS